MNEDLGLPSGVKYSLSDCKLQYVVEMPLEYYEVCPKDVVHTFRMLEPWDDKWVKVGCGRPWCVPCEALKMARFRAKIHRYLNHWEPPYLWLLTRSNKNAQHLPYAFDKLHSAVKQLAQQNKTAVKTEHNKISHYIGTYEVKHALDTGFNVHQHLIIGTEHDYLDFQQLHKEWDLASGYKAHLDVRQIRHGIGGAISYITAYISKGIWGGLSTEMAYWQRKALFGRHRIRTKLRTAVFLRVDPLRCFCCKTEYRNCNQGHVLPGEES